MDWAWGIQEWKKNYCRESLGKLPLGRSERRWEDNITLVLCKNRS